jgi:surface antigen
VDRLLLSVLLLPCLAWAQDIDPTDAHLREQAYLHAWSAPLGQATRWRNPATGDDGRITAIREHKAPQSDELCRDMVETLTVAGTLIPGALAFDTCP